MKHVLFIYSPNRLRSPTAEKMFSGRPGFEVASAGLNPEAESCVSKLEWADVVFVMERSHRNKLSKKFRAYLVQDFLVEGYPISRVGDHLKRALAEPKATSLTRPFPVGKFSSLDAAVALPGDVDGEGGVGQSHGWRRQ